MSESSQHTQAKPHHAPDTKRTSRPPEGPENMLFKEYKAYPENRPKQG